MKINLPKNIQKYKTKVVAGLSFRQLLFCVVGVIIFGFFAFLFSKILYITMACIVSAIVAIPVFMIGFVKVSGLTFEKIIVRVIRAELFKKDFRPYKREGFVNNANIDKKESKSSRRS